MFLFSLCWSPPLLSFILSWIDLQIHCIFPSTSCYTLYFFCFNLTAFWFMISCVHLPCILLLYTVCFLSLSLTVSWIPKCSACSLEGEWLLTSWCDWFIITQIWPVVLFFLPPHRGTCNRNRHVVFHDTLIKVSFPVLRHTTETRWMYKMPDAFTTFVNIYIDLLLLIKVYMKDRWSQLLSYEVMGKNS